MTVTPGQIGCALLSQSSRIAPFALAAYSHIHHTDQEYNELALFNPTSLARSIGAFLDHYRLRRSFASIALSGPNIKEEIVITSSAHPDPQELHQPGIAHRVVQVKYLYPHEGNQHAWYVCSIDRPTLLQYELLAHMAQLNLVRITTLGLAQLQLYRHMYGAAFRPAQLGIQLARAHNNIEHLFTPESIRRALYVPLEFHEAKQYPQHLLGSCGLFVSEEGYGIHH
jgi:hypothetical protein